MRARIISLLPLLTLLAIACGPGSGETSNEDMPELIAACDAQCDAQLACESTSLSEDECPAACLADIGTPGDPCAQAIEALAACLADNCEDELACDPELVERDVQCGGRG